MLDVSRILQGKLNLKMFPVNLVLVIEAGLETVRLAAEAKNIQETPVFWHYRASDRPDCRRRICESQS
ncbi:MAG: hypothetical protein V7K38_00155 [Nostoc sp.]